MVPLKEPYGSTFLFLYFIRIFEHFKKNNLGANLVGKSTETTNVTTSSIPQTGDNIILYISMLGLSVISIIGIEVYTKKFN